MGKEWIHQKLSYGTTLNGSPVLREWRPTLLPTQFTGAARPQRNRAHGVCRRYEVTSNVVGTTELAYPDRCRQQRYEVQSLRLGELTIVALEGEVCSEWGGMARAMAPTKHAMVVAYANHCPGYIPTARIIREGVQPACHAGRRRLAKPSEGSGRNAFFLGPNGPRFKKKASRKLCSPLFRRGGRCRRSLRRHFRASLGAHETKRVCARRAIPPAHVYAVQFARIAAVKSVNPIIDIER